MASAAIDVLFLEDDEGEALAVRRVLAASGGRYRLAYAHDVESALKRLSHGRVDVVLLDLAGEVGRGLEWVRRLREADEAVPIVVLAAPRELEAAAKAVECGARDVFVKNRADGAALLSALDYDTGLKPHREEGRPWSR